MHQSVGYRPEALLPPQVPPRRPLALAVTVFIHGDELAVLHHRPAVDDGVVHRALEAHGAQQAHGIELRAHQLHPVQVDQKRSAAMPAAREPISIRPRSRAEPRVASFRMRSLWGPRWHEVRRWSR